MSDGPHVLIVGPSNLGPYHHARYEALARECTVTVACMPIREHHRPWTVADSSTGFTIRRPFEGLGPRHIRTTRRRARALIAEVRPDVIIGIGYGSPHTALVAWEAKRRRIPRLVVLETARGDLPRRPARWLAKRQLCQTLYCGALVPGMRADRVARSLGFGIDRIFHVGNAVDNDHFAPRDAVTERTGFVCVSRLSPEKNISRLLDAFAAYRRRGGRWDLRIVGDGPLREELEGASGTLDGVRLDGWASYDDLPGILHGAGCLVLPSTFEPWGLTVNEGMAAGLPVIVSTACGAAAELCRSGVNGLVVDPLDRRALEQAMWTMSEELDADDRRAMGAASETLVSTMSLESWAGAVVRSARLVAEKAP